MYRTVHCRIASLYAPSATLKHTEKRGGSGCNRVFIRLFKFWLFSEFLASSAVSLCPSFFARARSDHRFSPPHLPGNIIRNGMDTEMKKESRSLRRIQVIPPYTVCVSNGHFLFSVPLATAFGGKRQRGSSSGFGRELSRRRNWRKLQNG